MSQPTFFQEIPVMKRMIDIADLSLYRDVPEDWLIAITDVRGSTKAIAAGKYKAVNCVAAATITSILNSAPEIEFPFSFGGDGASVVVPPEVEAQVRQALAAVKRLARDQFDLDLRIGLVPVQDVLAGGRRVSVGKVYISEQFQQPVFAGGGLDYADQLIKDPATEARYAVTERGDERADFSGFECRWNRHPAQHEEVISLLVQATGAHDQLERYQIYRDVLQLIEAIYGDVARRHPVDEQLMRVALHPEMYQFEVSVRQEERSWRKSLQLMFWSIAGYIRWRFVDKIWERYRSIVHQATDHEKFDDMLRMTISGTSTQREDLVARLEARHQAGDLVYGLHKATHSLMTCLVFDRFGRQVHFVDADEGGYAAAALELKAQLKALQVSVRPERDETETANGSPAT